MRVPLSLLSQMVDLPESIDELAEKMNGRVSEIEHIHRFPSRQAFADVVRVELVQVVQESADYQRWEATCSTGTVHMVVGKKHGVRAGEAFCAVLSGGSTPLGEPVTGRDLDGLASDGMLLSEESAGVGSDSTHPLRLAPDVLADADLWQALGLDDVVLEFDLEPNRSDLFSLIGMARDVSAIYGVPLRAPTLADDSAWGSSALKIDVKAPACTRYAALELRGLGSGPAPQWLQNAVRKLGMRPINAVVDAANLAMMELGHPMHTFDRATITSGVIGLRMAAPDETITTLDGTERTLTDECLLVTDGDRPVALAGIMGDASSEIGPETDSVVIEAAHFDMFTVRRASRRLALRTEASLRFEKGLAPQGVMPAVRRLVQLLSGLYPDTQVLGLVDHWPEPPADHVIAFDPDLARKRLGMDVPDDLIRSRFAALGHQVAPDWSVTIPPWRPDLRIQEDLNEEVGRIHGYEHVVAELPKAELAPPKANPVFTRGFAARRTLTGLGFDEIYLGVWVSQQQVERFGLRPDTLVQLKNPLHAHLEFFRPSALPDLIEAVRENRKRHDSFKLFELAKVYGRIDGKAQDRNHLCGAVAGPGEDKAGERFYAARDAALAALAALGLSASVGIGEVPKWALSHCFHPGRQAVITVAGHPLGFVGELHPGLVRDLGLDEAFSAFFIDFQGLLDLPAERTRFVPPARFPGIEVHANVLAPERLLAAELLATVRAAGLERLEHADIRDVYAGKGVPDGHKRVTLELAFQHPDRSLRSEEVDAWVQALKSHLATKELNLEV